jgi:hypothetical protein
MLTGAHRRTRAAHRVGPSEGGVAPSTCPTLTLSGARRLRE